MEKICDINQLNSLIMNYLKKGVITNNFISLDEYKLYLEEGSLYYEKNDSVLMFFREVNGIYHTYFYIKAFEGIKLPKNVVIEVVNPNEDLTKYLLKLGLKIKKNRLEMELQEYSDANYELLEKPKKDELSQAYDIVLTNFDSVYGYIPSKSEFLYENVLVYKNENGEIDGVIHFKTTSHYSQILHIAVKKEKRLCGIGTKLLNGYINLEKGKCKSFRLWVNEGNEDAIKFYKKNGYAFLSRKSVIFSDIGDA